jgi:hypothetical protein
MSGADLEYGYARVAARLGQRPADRLWSQLHSARSVPALLEVLRATSSAPLATGIAADAGLVALELAWRQQLRTRIDEAAGWAPARWQTALRALADLPDLPAVVHLVTGGAPLAWMRIDPHLAAWAIEPAAARERALCSGHWAWVSASLRNAPAARRASMVDHLHPALRAWVARWRRTWPACSADEREHLEQVIQLVDAHIARFGCLSVEDTASARAALAAKARVLLRRAPAEPAALVAWLLLTALDIERLRGEFSLRAAWPQEAIA